MSLFLNPEELTELTGYTWRNKQIAALGEMGVPFRVNPLGRVLVSRSVVDGAPKPQKTWEPDWDAQAEA